VTKEKISEYDASADGNTDVNGVNIAEGCAPSGINNAIREVMGALKRFETGADGDSLTVGGNLVVSGSTTANTIGATVVNASGNATVGGTLVVTGATTFSGNVVVSGSTTANTLSVTTVSATVVQSDTISEKTSAAGVTVDGVLLKDTTVTANTIKASGTASSQGEVQLFEDTDNGTNYVAIKAAASIASNVTFVLPDADGTTGQALVTDGSGNLSFSSAGGSDYIMQTYTSPATWTKPAGLKAVKVTVIGGGGGGGGARGFPAPSPPPSGSSLGSFSGGGGGVSIEYIPAPSIPGPVTVTRGDGGAGGPAPATPGTRTTGTTGGTSSFGPFTSATGGVGGGASAGTGGSGSGGDINSNGGSGNFLPVGGGNPFFAFNGGAPNPGGNGDAATGQGAGGGGTVSPSSPSPRSGGAGSDGVVIVEEFY
jgi:hypothetical protein